MTDEEKLKVLEMAEEIANDLYGVATIKADDPHEASLLMAQCEILEKFGQILRDRWKLEKGSDNPWLSRY